MKQFVLRITGDSEETQKFLADDKINSSSNVTVRIIGLAADSTYRFQVAAMNDIGIGPYSEMSEEITTGKGIVLWFAKTAVSSSYIKGFLTNRYSYMLLRKFIVFAPCGLVLHKCSKLL